MDDLIVKISSEEGVVRLLSKEWFVKGVLQHTAFRLANGETYLSVNRPAIDSFCEDVKAFIMSHPFFVFGEGNLKLYRSALLNVGAIRNIAVKLGDTQMVIDVEVEPRATQTKSHAGIFTRFQNKNIKRGQLLKAGPISEAISADTILLEVRSQLLNISNIEEHEMK